MLFISLLWGVEAAHAPVATNIDGTTDIVNDYLVEHKLAEPGDLIVIAAGSPPGVAGSTNMLRYTVLRNRVPANMNRKSVSTCAPTGKTNTSKVLLYRVNIFRTESMRSPASLMQEAGLSICGKTHHMSCGYPTY